MNGTCITCSEELTEHQHDWIACKCRTCGSTRDTNHIWDTCYCAICGKENIDAHVWTNCICKLCNKIRDKDHKWAGCICEICGKIRDMEHDWDQCICKKCGKEEHIWEVFEERTHSEFPITYKSSGGLSSDRQIEYEQISIVDITYKCNKCGKEKTVSERYGPTGIV
ncbi:hypothetical protein JW887_04975 [Candidatus Dojkabacteria bacterium]|nr:hypothetical protein [Candidatus Dojkabacteria bacterium]